ncbi:MAG: hypothetical protein ACKVKG_18525 [Alphaproteobacteria bacterium]
MKHRNIITAAALLMLAGCAIVPYAPVAGLAASGADRASLREQPQYAKLIGVSLSPKTTGSRIWALRKFNKGRYFIERSDPNKNYTPFVCNLSGGEIVIKDIFEDKINGGVHYSASARCKSGAFVDAPRNHFYDA